MPSLSEMRESISSASSRTLDRAKGAMGIETQPSEDSAESMLEELSDMCPRLSFQQRLIGFASCFGLGYLITFTSFSFFVELVEGNPIPFCVVYTTGNILSLLSCTFLIGPKRQFKRMFDEKRIHTTTTYLSCLLATLIVVFVPMKDALKLLLLLLLLIAQFCSSVWYSLSYIPYGRATAKKCLKSAVGLDGSESGSIRLTGSTDGDV